MTFMVKIYWLITLVGIPASLVLAVSYPAAYYLTGFCLIWALVGCHDLYFSHSNLRRNYPLVSHIRYLLEYIRPEIHQYFIASNTEERPFNREERSLVYRRARSLPDTLPFGTEMDILEDGYLTAEHSLNPKVVAEKDMQVLFGGTQCAQPYKASRLNISAMSFGALSANAILALNKGAKRGGFAHNTGEGGLSSYHLEYGGDIIWQIGTGYFGCRHQDGSFNADAFQERAILKNVKMIEIKLSQGAKPSHGGILPAAKVSEEIAGIRLVEAGKDVISPPAHSAFNGPKGLLQFVQQLRQLSDGKPVGFKLCLGRKSEFLAICKGILETQIFPDFITIDGAEGGTGAAPLEFSNRLGTPCLEAVYYVNQVLTGLDIKEQIRLIASGKTASGFDLLTKIALGADTVNAARTMMLALGCVQSQACNTNRCPTGITTQNPSRGKAVDVENKHVRVANFHHQTVASFLQLCGAMGYEHPDMLCPSDIYRRFDQGLMHFDEIYTPLEAGQLLTDDIPQTYAADWQKASAEHF
jgi:glutamate synthase domain-containing protein 2